ncbi:E3 ubiquitin-protein ligase RMA1H1 [Dichanthelium oligosanthes]|uniref:E3 ubiquitin-protein ligase RMA n=1 Tax=Dichanthelium oligosanthes TaxID=888268 RepID=A0A1E5W1S1_9POAL|nr:E3 ubiquitin-protein ligase RMA1H1 [Dichanthelium oligosanthes]
MSYKFIDQTRAAGVNQQPAVAAGDEPAKRIVRGDAVAATGGGCFDCSICLECAAEPVVTLCGHLYCWPCIYEWLRPDADAEDTGSSVRRRCPVCKAAVSPDALVPLYGRGGSSSATKPTRGRPGIPRLPVLRHGAKVDSDSSGGHYGSVESDAPARTPQQVRRHAGVAQFDALVPPPLWTAA